MAKSKKDKRNNIEDKKIKLLFFENQGTGNTCRLHAINNALGRSVVSRKKFFAYCDEFDRQNHCQGSREFFFIHSNSNIITFILDKLHVQSSYYPPDDPPHLSDDSCDDVMAVMIFNDEHIWCVKKHENTWFNLDSSSKKPTPILFRSIFARQRLGWIIVWKSSNEQSFESSPKSISEDLNIVTMRQSAKPRSRQSSSRHSIEEADDSGESSSNAERNESKQSNRFATLSYIEL